MVTRLVTKKSSFAQSTNANRCIVQWLIVLVLGFIWKFSFVLVLLGRPMVQCCLAVISLVSWGRGHSSAVKMLSAKVGISKCYQEKIFSLFMCVLFLHSFFFHINFLGMSNTLSLRKHVHLDITIEIYS